MKTSRIRVKLPNQKIADFCRRHNIRKLAVFARRCARIFVPTVTWTCWWSLSQGTRLG
jgi:hypothetical protein